MVQLDNSIPNQIDIPEFTTANLQKYYGEIDTLWDSGTQLATLDRVPYSRVFNVLSFPNNDSYIDVINLGTYVEEYEGSFYYLVSNYFYEDSYKSSIANDRRQDFLRWIRTRTKIRQEIVYVHKKIGELTWVRPSIGGPDNPIFNVLPDNYVLPLIEVGKALAASIESISPIEVRTKLASSDPGEIITNLSNISLTKPYLEITLKNPTNLSHQEINIDFFGEYKWRTFTPLEELEEDTLIHPISVPLINRYKPPGLSSLEDNFWNSQGNTTVIASYSNRGFDPRWI